ncbi:MAG: low molecular weight protein-tyrosine-phosphatase [Pseudomonadota bacterium]
MTTQVLFVCMGNICRSPTAHGVLNHMASEMNLSNPSHIIVDSAGTGAWHIGAPPDKRAMKAAKARGYDLKQLRARQLVTQDFDRFDYVLGMDRDNLEVIESLKPAAYKGQTGLLLDYADEVDYVEVPDPYYGGEKGFELVLDLVERACMGLLEHINSGEQTAR